MAGCPNYSGLFCARAKLSAPRECLRINPECIYFSKAFRGEVSMTPYPSSGDVLAKHTLRLHINILRPTQLAYDPGDRLYFHCAILNRECTTLIV